MIRVVRDADAQAMVEIYRPSIEQSAISFEIAVPSADEMRERVDSCLQQFPWIVDESEGRVRGYAYAAPYHARAAYRWAAIVSVYVGEGFLRQGVAGQLYRVLFSLLQEQGIRQVLAAIAVPNPASQQFHESLGFRKVGEMPDVGYKLGQWQSMGWWQRALGEGAESSPDAFVPFTQIATKLPEDLAIRLNSSRSDR